MKTARLNRGDVWHLVTVDSLGVTSLCGITDRLPWWRVAKVDGTFDCERCRDAMRFGIRLAHGVAAARKRKAVNDVEWGGAA